MPSPLNGHSFRPELLLSMCLLVVTERHPRLFDAGYLAWLRKLPCTICRTVHAVEAAHIRFGLTGIGRKPDDARAVPLCAVCHRVGPASQHATGDEQAWWARHGIDPLKLAEKLYAEYGGDGGKPKGPQKIKPRKPREERAKLKSRNTFQQHRPFPGKGWHG